MCLRILDICCICRQRVNLCFRFADPRASGKMSSVRRRSLLVQSRRWAMRLRHRRTPRRRLTQVHHFCCLSILSRQHQAPWSCRVLRPMDGFVCLAPSTSRLTVCQADLESQLHLGSKIETLILGFCAHCSCVKGEGGCRQGADTRGARAACGGEGGRPGSRGGCAQPVSRRGGG